MNIFQCRADVASSLTTALRAASDLPPSAANITIHPYRPRGVKVLNGWVRFNKLDSEAVTFSENRVTFDVFFPISSDEAAAEEAFDLYAGPFIKACRLIGSDVTVTPTNFYYDSTTLLYSLVATFTTESEVG